MMQALQNAASGIRLGTAMLDAAARNLARSGTDDDQREEVIGAEIPEGGVKPVIIPGVDDGPAADLVASIIAKHTVTLNAAMFRRANSTSEGLVDLVG